MGGLARRIGEHHLIRFGVGLLALTLLGIAFAPSLLVLKLLSACIAIGNGVSNPSLSALIMQSAGKEDRGLISGAQQGLSSMARILAPPINNYFVGINTAIPFLSSAVLMGISFLYSMLLPPILKGDSDSEPTLGH